MVTAGIVTAIVLAGCSSTSTAPNQAPATSPPPSRSAATVSFSAYSDNDGPVATVVVTGAIGDYGHLVSVRPDGTPDADHASELAFELHRGTFRVDIAGLGRQLAARFSAFPTNRGTCSGRVTVARPARIIAGAGTGAYVNTRGELNLSVTIDEVDQRARCGPSARFLAQNVIITGTGTIS